MFDLFGKNFVVNPFGSDALKWQTSQKQVISADSESPQIGAVWITLQKDHFRRNVRKVSSNIICWRVFNSEFYVFVEALDSEVAVFINENIFKAKIAIKKVNRLKFLENDNKLGDVKVSQLFRDLYTCLKFPGKISSNHEGCDELNFVFGREYKLGLK